VPKVSVVFDEQEQQDTQMILVDGDGAAALRFLKQVVWSQVQEVRHKGLRSHLEAGREVIGVGSSKQAWGALQRQGPEQEHAG